MKIVLDEGVPRTLAGAFRAVGLDADPFDRTWIGLRNGVLLRRVAAAGYTVLLTNDTLQGMNAVAPRHVVHGAASAG